MCVCTPNKRTPYCGETPECQWPEKPSPSSLRANTPVVLEQPQIIETICQHVSMAGNLYDLCKMWHIDYYLLTQQIGANALWEQKMKAARQAGSDYLEERILGELKLMAFVDIRRAYDKSGSLLAMHDLPDDVAASISSVDVDDLFSGFGKDREKVGETKKVRLHSKQEAIKMLGDFRGMWKKADIGNLGKTLEDLISNSNTSKPTEEPPSV